MVRLMAATTLSALLVGCSPGEQERVASSGASSAASTSQPVPVETPFDDAKYVRDNGFDRCAPGGICDLLSTADQCSLIPVAREHADAVLVEIRRVGHPRCFGPKVRGTASCVNGRCVAQLTTEGVPD